MNKVFLYLYPIAEYTKMFLLHDTEYDESPLVVLNECIQKRYRDKGFQVVYVLYPDTDIYGINPQIEDKIIYTDVAFNEKVYPNEVSLLKQLGPVQKLVIGGYHYHDCVKRVGETALEMGIDTMVDLDLTDLFFNLYQIPEYFKIDAYDPQRYMNYWKQKEIKNYGNQEFIDNDFKNMYDSPIYQFSLDENISHKK